MDALTLRQLQHYVHSCFTAGDSAVSWPGCLVGSGVSSLSRKDGQVILAAADFRDMIRAHSTTGRSPASNDNVL